jgi:hypothetical protein
MTIETVELTEDGSYLVNGSMTVPNNSGNRHYQGVQEWIAEGNTPDPYVAPPEPTIDDIYDMALQNNDILRKLILGLNDGTFVPGSNYTNQQIKNGLK